MGSRRGSALDSQCRPRLIQRRPCTQGRPGKLIGTPHNLEESQQSVDDIVSMSAIMMCNSAQPDLAARMMHCEAH